MGRGSALAVRALLGAILAAVALPPERAPAQAVSFTKSLLQGESSDAPTALQFGPDGRLYVAQQNGILKVYTIARNGPGDYVVTATETITLIKAIPNHDDDGALNPAVVDRQVTGMLVTGTPASPVVFVSSSDPRIAIGIDTGLDTNSGIVSRLTWNGAAWQKLDLVRGLPRGEENHSVNGMQLDAATNTLYLGVGGNTNMGAPSNNFAFLPEYALSAAILAIDLGAIGNTTYDLPTLDDASRPNTGPGDSDLDDPFGGNNGLNQAILVPGGPVQVFSPGYRNAYDLVLTADRRLYTVDNGPNAGWGGPPAGEGPAGACTNAPNDSDSASFADGLHYITGPGYYAGHPNPTRANPANTFGGQSPVPAGNPVECDYRAPGPDNGALATWDTSVNGLVEYTASNFGGAMQGNLLACGWGTAAVYRIELNPAGTAVVSSTTLFNNSGANPLDVTAQGDGKLFAGTIWVGNYGSGDIAVYEPADLAVCTGADSPLLDEDVDGYTNADEIDNGTDPCSGGDVPADFDGDLLSDLNDADDDDDGILDVSDAFARDPLNGLNTKLPIDYGWGVGEPGFGFFGTGFTGLMTNGAADYLDLFEQANLTAGGAAGKITIDSVPAGDAYEGLNTQAYAFQFGVDVSTSTGPFIVATAVDAPFFDGLTPVNYQALGAFIGAGDQDNYVKITLAANNGAGGAEVLRESNGVAVATMFPLPGALAASSVELSLLVNPDAGTIQPRAGLNGGAPGNLGGPLPLSGPTLDAVRGAPALAVGLIATSSGAPPFTATWDYLRVLPLDTGASASVVIDPSGDSIDGSTYNPGSFAITNTSTGGQKIVRVVFDLTTALLPDLVFDPSGTAGDLVAKPFSEDVNGGTGAITHSYLDSFHNGLNAGDGYDRLQVGYSDFGPGETMTFSIDNDPTSIKGTTAPGPNESGSVSGLELCGSRLTVEFSDGAVLTGHTFRTGAALDASSGIVRPNPAPAPLLEVVGVASTPAVVANPQQVVRVAGPPGAEVQVLVAEAGLFLTGLTGSFPNGYDLDPFEANSLVAVRQYAGVVGAGGTVDIPITLSRLDPAADPGVGAADVTGLNHLMAVVRDPGGRTGVATSRVVLQLDEAFQCTNGDPCDDADACTINDACAEGNCVGEPRDCDDGVGCTQDSCDPAAGCRHVDDCPAGQSCNRTSGACESPPSSGCLSDAHCGPCQRCVNLACVPVVCGPCEDCNDNHGCEPAENCCAADDDCAACEECLDERCAPLECPEGTTCGGAHECVEVDCTEDEDCPAPANFCDGERVCADHACTTSGNPCSGAVPICDEVNDRCVACREDDDCGGNVDAPFCADGVCIAGFALTPCFEAEDGSPLPPCQAQPPAAGAGLAPGSSVTLCADDLDLPSGYQFDSWRGVDDPSADCVDVLLDANRTITALLVRAEPDGDGDGIPDAIDLCPATSACAVGEVDSTGCCCDELDADDDGVDDCRDACADTPENVAVCSDGCPAGVVEGTCGAGLCGSGGAMCMVAVGVGLIELKRVRRRNRGTCDEEQRSDPSVRPGA